MRIRFSIGLMVAAAIAWAQAPDAAKPAAAKPAEVKPAETKPAREPGLYAILNTSMGVIVARLFEKEAPATVRNFVALSRGTKPWKDPKTNQMVTRPLYSGTVFHRVIPGFMIQGGDPMGSGFGDGGIQPLPDEFSKTMLFDQPGRLAMANTGQPRSSTCQFFITVAPYPSLNGNYSLFGQVVEGQEVANKISTVPRDSNDKPRGPVRLVSIVIKREGPAPEPAAKKAVPAAKKAVPAAKKAAPAAPKPAPPAKK